MTQQEQNLDKRIRNIPSRDFQQDMGYWVAYRYSLDLSSQK